jgi:squalene-hopene/tetraprenyl-beta-curcumene cyclase
VSIKEPISELFERAEVPEQVIPLRALGAAAERAHRDAAHPAIIRVDAAIEKASSFLLSLQREDGHWCGPLEGCTILESEYMLLLQFLGREGEPRFRRAGAYLRRRQEAHGGWSIYPKGPPDVSTSVKAYFALKMCGDSPDAEHMVLARKVIHELGGLEASNSFTKIYLSIFGQWDWAACPAIPPEMILLPNAAYFNIYEMSSWSRAMVVPLSILWAIQPVRRPPESMAITELRTGNDPPARTLDTLEERVFKKAFLAVDRSLKFFDRHNLHPLRRVALARAERWIFEHSDRSDGLGAIFPPIVNTVFALTALGHPSTHPVIRAQLAELEALEIQHDGALEVQPCKGPVWDTALALRALLEVPALRGDARLIEASTWLLDRELHEPGECAIHSPGANTGGWFFQYNNIKNPDCDDTAQVLSGLSLLQLDDREQREITRAARERAVHWLLAMQNKDGGWGAFDRGCTKTVLTYVPFADHNAMIDPSCPDITGRTLVALAQAGVSKNHPAVRRAVRYLKRSQNPDGTWYGRWGTNYIYGTWLGLEGLRAQREDLGQLRYQRAGDWLRARQTPSGGWGESPASYDDPTMKGRGPITAAQTAWALLALFALGDHRSESVARGVQFLLDLQSEAGAWEDLDWTGTGFPRVFYLRYHLYDKYFPLLALAAYRNRVGAAP